MVVHQKKVMVFGTFDGLHEGHRSFLIQARKLGDFLIVVVACDEVVNRLKGHFPNHSLSERMQALKDENLVDEVTQGDKEEGTWQVIGEHWPSVIALGYDQQGIAKELKNIEGDFMSYVKVVVMDAHKPDKYHSSLLSS